MRVATKQTGELIASELLELDAKPSQHDWQAQLIATTEPLNLRPGHQIRMVIRAGVTDMALVRLTEPANKTPLLLLKDKAYLTRWGSYSLNKVTIRNAWQNIPARRSPRSQERFYISKSERHGGAGSSGSPWTVSSPLVGDVLVGVTHGTGRVPQVGFMSEWIQRNVDRYSDDTLVWATYRQAFRPDSLGSGTPLGDNEQQWTFALTRRNNVTLSLGAEHITPGDSNNFQFQYTLDRGKTWINLLEVTSSSNGIQPVSVALPNATDWITVRVVNPGGTPGGIDDSLRIHWMAFERTSV